VAFRHTLPSSLTDFEVGDLSFQAGGIRCALDSLTRTPGQHDGAEQFETRASRSQGPPSVTLILSAGPGGVDLKRWKFVTLEGNETVIKSAGLTLSIRTRISSTSGIPFTHTGAVAIWRDAKVDLYGEVTRGINTSID